MASYQSKLLSWSIRKKLLAVVMLLFLSAASVLTWLGLEKRSGLIEKAEKDALLVVESVAAQQEQIVTGTKYLLSTLAQVPAVQRLDSVACNEMFSAINNLDPFFAVIAATTSDGILFAASKPFQPPIDLSDRRHIADTIQTLEFSAGDLILGRVSKTYSINFSYPVLDKDKKLVATVAAGFNVKEYARFLARIPLPEGFMVNITDCKGARLYRLPENVDIPPGSPIPGDLYQLISGKSDRGTVERFGEDGIYRIYAFRQLKLREEAAPYLYIIGGLPKARVVQKANLEIVGNLLILGIIGTAALALTLFLANITIAWPIKKLAIAAQKIGGGEMGTRTGLPQTQDELGKLAQSFDSMAGLLEKRYVEQKKTEETLSKAYAVLESSAQERTSELSVPNASLMVEITERERTEAALRKSEELYRSLFDNMLNGFAHCRMLFEGDHPKDFIYLNVNKAFETLTGLKDVMGKKVSEVIPGVIESDPDLLEIYGRVALTGKPERCEIYVKALEMWFWISVYSPQKEYFVAVFDVITERKKAEDASRDSEAQLRQIIDLVPHKIFVKDWDGKYLLVNQAVAEGYNTNVSAITGKYHADFHPDQSELQRMLQDDREVMTKGETKFIPEETYTGAKGDLRFLQTTKVPFNIVGHKTGAVLGVAIDITERKLAEEERTHLATAIEQVGEGVIITDANWNIQYANPAFKRITGYEGNDIIGQHTRILKSDMHEANFYRQVREALTQRGGWAGRLINKKKDGTLYHADVTASAVRDKSGEITNYVTIHRDITDQVDLEKELLQAQKMEAVGNLAGGIAHDFNNILAVVMGFTELSLRKIPEDSPVRGNLENVLKAASRASEVVKQILTFSRQSEQERKPVSLAPIVEEAIKFLRFSLPASVSIIKEMEIGPGEDVVKANQTQIHQVLMNLGTNAAHSMRTKGGILKIKLSGNADTSLVSGLGEGPHLCLTVSDTGHGIDPAVTERIFDPYFTTKEPGQGTGLGLSVVQGIVTSYGGAITAKSVPGQGTTFHVFLPVYHEEGVLEVQAVEGLPTGSERILFVDDEGPLADLGKEILEALGYHVTAGTGSLEALEAFRADPGAFDLVITDSNMPGLTGRELSEEIMAIRSNMPIILCSGFSDSIIEEQAREAGIREVIMKPYEIATVAKAVRKVLDRNDMACRGGCGLKNAELVSGNPRKRCGSARRALNFAKQ